MGFVKYVRAQWDRAGAVGFAAIGLLVLILGWVGVSGTPYLAKQMPYMISGGLAGIFLLGVGSVLWISADLRDEWRQLKSVEIALRELKSEQVRGTDSGGALSNGVSEHAQGTWAKAEGGASK
jgi:hypothetical protein